MPRHIRSRQPRRIGKALEAAQADELVDEQLLSVLGRMTDPCPTWQLAAGRVHLKLSGMAEADSIVDLYNRHAHAWVRARLRQEAKFYERRWLEQFRGLIGAGGSVIDIGCGAGAPMATYLVRHGYSVTGVDSSTEMIQLFRARLPGHEALVTDMRRLSLERAFHGILAWDSFFHLSHDDQRRMFPIFRLTPRLAPR